MTTDIGRPQLHPAMRELIARRRAEELATQSWTPGCAHCGECAPKALPVEAARAWWDAHRAECAALARAA